MAFQSLYRRFRPQRFGEVIGQDHLVTALRNAVVQERVAHAYLLSGPRGTGKTTTARILAKALNCQDLGDDGEPCCQCDSCVAIEHGSSMDLYELDAASNNGVDNMRELNANAAIGTPGRRKVYLLDEVHMLTPGASNALLKTLEEPPDHVVFILATTDPHKVLPTVRSRTQHFELGLVGADLLADHVRRIAERAGIEVDDATVDHVVAAGRGSVRDALSALDLVVAAGGVDDPSVDVDAVIDGLAAGDTAVTLGAVARIVASGVDARDLGDYLARRLRDVFLVLMRVEPGQLPSGVTEKLQAMGEALGAATTVRALELVGTALVDMRQAPDARLTLEVALVRLTAPEADTTVEALLQRIERLERGIGGADGASRPSGAAGARQALADASAQEQADDATPKPPPAEPDPSPAEGDARSTDAPSMPLPPPPPPPPTGGRSSGRTATEPSPSSAAPPPAPEVVAPDAEPTPDPAPAASAPAAVSRDQLTIDWEELLKALPGRARARFAGGRWLAVEGDTAVFALPNEPHRQRCTEVLPDVEAALAERYGPMALRLVADAEDVTTEGPAGSAVPAPGTPVAPDQVAAAEVDEELSVDTTVPAETGPTDSLSRITDAFPGAVVLEPDDPPGGRR